MLGNSIPHNLSVPVTARCGGRRLASHDNIWVCDRGPAGNYSYLKKFQSTEPDPPEGGFLGKFSANLMSPYGTYQSYCAVIGIATEGETEYLYTSGGEMLYADHIAKWLPTYNGDQVVGADLIATFEPMGPGPGESRGPWGGFSTPWGTVLSACWFGCKAQEWGQDGTWIQVFQSSLRSDAYSIKCRNHTKYIDSGEQLHDGEDKRACQRVTLPQQGTYRLQSLAYTNGQLVDNGDVLPYASYTGQPGNAVFSTSWENYVVTDVDIPGESDCYAAYVWGRFNVAAGQTGFPWDIGVDVKVNQDPAKPRLVYISSLSCWKE